MFYRVSSAVIAPNLINDLSLNTKSLGVLGGAFFYSFALLQIPMGILLDRISPRLVITVFSIIGASGAFIFSGSHTFITALLGRILTGAGMACVLMSSLKIFVLRFSPKQFSTLSGAIISVGMLGTIMASSPLAYMTMTIGWRTTFLYAGLVTALLACLAFWILKDGHQNAALSSDHAQHMALPKVIRLVLGNLSFWQIGACAFFRYGTLVALQGLWLGPYLIQIKGFSAIGAGNMLMILSIGYIAGSPIAGYLSDRVFQSAKTTNLCGVGLYTLTLIPLTGLIEFKSHITYSIIFFMIGFFNSFGMLGFAHVKQLFPMHISATAIAGINFFSMSGGAVLMPVIGKIIDALTAKDSGDPSQAYHLAFLICFLGMAATLALYSFSKDGK